MLDGVPLMIGGFVLGPPPPPPPSPPPPNESEMTGRDSGMAGCEEVADDAAFASPVDCEFTETFPEDALAEAEDAISPRVSGPKNPVAGKSCAR